MVGPISTRAIHHRPQQAWTAPATLSVRTRPNGTGANAESFALTRCAITRGLERGRRPIRGHNRSAMLDQRTRQGQPVVASPSNGNAPKADRTAAADQPPCDHWASAAAITLSVYKQRRATSAGITSATASHARHTYRRARISLSCDRPPTCTTTVRARTPCPCSTRQAPTGWLAAPQPGQRGGRATDTDGGPSRNHRLTSTPERTIRTSLRPSKMLGARRGPEVCRPGVPVTL